MNLTEEGRGREQAGVGAFLVLTLSRACYAALFDGPNILSHLYHVIVSFVILVLLLFLRLLRPLLCVKLVLEDTSNNICATACMRVIA
jgi:hypothetical protein